MVEDHGAPEAEQLSRALTRVCRVIESRQKANGQRVHSLTVQNEMKGVLGRVSAGAAPRILDSANPKETRDSQKTMSVAAKTKESTKQA